MFATVSQTAGEELTTSNRKEPSS